MIFKKEMKTRIYSSTFEGQITYIPQYRKLLFWKNYYYWFGDAEILGLPPTKFYFTSEKQAKDFLRLRGKYTLIRDSHNYK